MARYSKPQRDLSSSGGHDIGLAVPSPRRLGPFDNPDVLRKKPNLIGRLLS